MALTPYCEPAEVRAALGANSVELPDAVLDLPIYQIGLMRELTRLSPSLPALFTGAADARPEDRTADQVAIFDATRLFSVYASARQVGVSLGAMLPKDVGDGKATVSRFSDAPYKDVLNRVNEMLAVASEALRDVLKNLAGSTVVAVEMPKFFVTAPRLVDPVTGS